jgi:predicted nucleotidyltransferase
MEQKRYNKDYKLEIVISLLKERSHIRELAKKLSTNPMTILRRVKELQFENVLDFEQKGKNKVYFLKRNPEANTYALMAEQYALLRTLEKYPELRAIIENIKKHKEIEIAILFGSYAKGTATKDSDIDVYVETKDKRVKKELEFLDTRLSIKIGSFERESKLIKEIEKNHIILKGAEKYYEKSRFFE